MDKLFILKQLVDEYIAFALKLRKDTSDLRSLFGPRTEEINHPGHGQFDAAVENWVRDFAAGQPVQEELDAALEVLLFSSAGQENKAPYWYLTAIQRHSMLLIPMLNDRRRAALLKRFAAAYPPKRQVPIQTEVYQLLAPDSPRRSFRLWKK